MSHRIKVTGILLCYVCSWVIIQRLHSPGREAFLYGIRHISSWFNEVRPYASLNRNRICCVWKCLTYGTVQSLYYQATTLFIWLFWCFDWNMIIVMYGSFHLFITKCVNINVPFLLLPYTQIWLLESIVTYYFIDLFTDLWKITTWHHLTNMISTGFTLSTGCKFYPVKFV